MSTSTFDSRARLVRGFQNPMVTPIDATVPICSSAAAMQPAVGTERI